MRKPKSRVGGDLPREIVNRTTDYLAIPLHLIINESFYSETWPEVWKIETIVPIPKTLSPGSFNDIRPISMTTLWSCLLYTSDAADE